MPRSVASGKRGPVARTLGLAALGAAVTLTVTVTVLAPRSAYASGYLTARYGSDQGSPAMPNTYAVYFNPAAMGGTHGTTLTVDASIFYRYASYQRGSDALSPSSAAVGADQTYIDANTGKASLNNVIAAPYVGIVSDLGSQAFRVGAAIHLPYGGLAQWNTRENTAANAPGAQDGVQRWANISGQILAIHGTLAASYTIDAADLTIGANVSGVVHHVATARARNLDGSDDVNTVRGRLQEGRSLLDVSGFNVGATIGLYWQPKRLGAAPMRDRLKLGLSYISQPGFGETKMNGTLRTVLGTSVEQAPQDVSFYQSYPDIIRFGGAYRTASDKLEIRSDFEFVRWSVFKNQCVSVRDTPCDVNSDGSAVGDPKLIILNVKRNWQNAVGARLGMAYFVDYPGFEVFGSLGFTTSAVPKETIDASTIDSFRLYGVIGLRKELGQHFALGASYNHVYFMPVETNNASIHDGVLNPSKSPSADGTYKSQIGFLNINGSYTF